MIITPIQQTESLDKFFEIQPKGQLKKKKASHVPMKARPTLHSLGWKYAIEYAKRNFK